MKKNFLYGIMLAVAFLLSGASFASPFTGATFYDDHSYQTVAFTADTVDPGDFSPAAKPDNSGLVNYRYDSYAVYAHFKAGTNSRMPRTVLACGFESEPIAVPTRIPMAV